MSPSTDLRENREFASELKFVVGRPLAEQIHNWVRARLGPDPNASGRSSDAYQITSLYFDTKHFDVFHRRGSFGRSKYRIRRYGVSGVVFLERKLKTRGLVSKRRTIVGLDELQRLNDPQPDRDWTGYWYQQRLLARRLQPICQISYRRIARVALSSNGPVRLTLDEDIQAHGASRLVFADDTGGAGLCENKVVIELKYRLEMPAMFKLLVEEFALNPQPVSKYRLAAVAIGYVKEPVLDDSRQGHMDRSICPIF